MVLGLPASRCELSAQTRAAISNLIGRAPALRSRAVPAQMWVCPSSRTRASRVQQWCSMLRMHSTKTSRPREPRRCYTASTPPSFGTFGLEAEEAALPNLSTARRRVGARAHARLRAHLRDRIEPCGGLGRDHRELLAPQLRLALTFGCAQIDRAAVAARSILRSTVHKLVRAGGR